MADPSHARVADNTATELGTNTQTARNMLLKRNSHLRGTDTSSPAGFGGLGTRQFLQKQLMTPGSATSASSFEEGASYDGFSDADTPAYNERLAIKSGAVQHTSLDVKTGGVEPGETHYVTRSVSNHPTKRLSYPSRESLARRLIETSTNDENPSEMLRPIVIKTVPSIDVGHGDASNTMTKVPLSPRSTKVTRRIVASPRQIMRRVVTRRTDADGLVHQQVTYVDADGQVVHRGGNYFNAKDHETDDTLSTMTRRNLTPPKTVRRVVRRTGADGQFREQVQYLDADGNVVQTADGNAATSDSTVSSSGTIVTRRTGTPDKTIRRVLIRKTGVDGQVHEQVQYLDATGNVVQSDGSDFNNRLIKNEAAGSSAGRTSTTNRNVDNELKRVLIRKKGVDGEIHEEVQYVDADGHVVSKSGSFTTEQSMTQEGFSETSGRRKVTRRVIQRTPVRTDDTSVPLEHYNNSYGNVEEGNALVSVGSFTGSVSSVTSESSTGRRVVTRRVVTSPGTVVRRTVVHKAGSISSEAESDEDVQYLDADGRGLAKSGSFTRTVTTPGRRIVTRHVVTPQRVVRRLAVRKGTAGSVVEADKDDLDIDAEFVQSEDNVSSDESVGGSSRDGSSRGGYTVSDRIVIPGSEARRVVSRTGTSSKQPREVVDAVTEIDAASNVKVATGVSSTNQSEKVTTRTPVADGGLSDEEDKAPIPMTKAVTTTSKTMDGYSAADTEDDELQMLQAVYNVGEVIETDDETAPVVTVTDAKLDGKSEPLKAQTTEVKEVESVLGSLRSPSSGTRHAVVISEAQQELPVSQDSDDKTRSPAPATVTTEESETLSTVPHRKAGRSIWKFWGADKPKFSLTNDEKPKDEEQHVIQTEICATYDPELHSPAKGPRDVDSPRDAGVAGGIMETEITQTSVETKDEVASERVCHDAPDAGTVADMIVVTESQQPVERENVECEQPNDAKPACTGGFWGFVGDRPEEPAAVLDNSGVQVEAVRRSLPSDSLPSNAVGPVASNEKLLRESERRITELIDGVEPDVELDEHYVEIVSPRHNSRTLSDDGLWTVTPCSLAWNTLRLNRKHRKNALYDGHNDVLLDSVSGSVKAGEFLVITGPSKDESLALLSCLAGYEDAMEGHVTVNGRAWNASMTRYIAYVMREDLFFETLTVYEHLVSQAQLRMRRTHTHDMCLERVECVIEDLGLSECRDKLIGGGISLRGITRGERKLLALATALLSNPSILLVDEPTDGLDTFSAEQIVAKLRWLALEKGLTVAVTLHHPSSHFYGLFDVLYLVADASCVYDGKAADCVAYFSTIGYTCPEYTSPIDYLMFQLVVNGQESNDVDRARVETLKRVWTERNASVYAENVARTTDAGMDDYQKNGYYHMNCCSQLWLLWTRHVRRLSRYGFVFWWHLLAALLIGLVFGLIYLQLDLNQHGIQNFAGSFFYVVVVQMLLITYRTFIFLPRETATALRERQEYRGGWYHLLCWYCTKLLAELPALILLSIALFVPVFVLVGIGHGFKLYVYMQIVLVFAGWAAVGLGFLTLGLLRHVTLALIVYAVLLVLFVAFGGLLINVTDIPDWLVWLHYLSPVKYAYEAMMKLFWTRVDSIDCDWTVEGCVARTGEEVLTYYSMENRSALGDTLLLLVICLTFFFVAFWFLLMLANKRMNGFQWRYDWTFKGPLGHKHQRFEHATGNEKDVGNRLVAAAERSTAADTDKYYIHVETPRVGSRGFCDAPRMTLGWKSLWLEAQTDQKTTSYGENEGEKYLLSDANGSAKCGELVLITGPSDASNVALLESLGGLQKSLQGKMTLNGLVTSLQTVSEHAAYVTREDFFYETLTVEEHLRFQAQLVIGQSSGSCGLCCASDVDTERVELVLDELELNLKRHVLIRYLSAADVKLLAMATALLLNPSLLLVEEPTFGMDFYSSQQVVLKLRQLARTGRTVVVTMTHPSSHLFALFDVLYLLADGAAVYHGKVTDAVPYFASLGYQCPQYMSPVDYLVRQVSVADDHATFFKETWSTRYSELYLADNSEEHEEQTTDRRRVGCCGQLSLLFHRHILSLARYHVVFGWNAFWMVVLGVLFGLVFFQLDVDNQQDIQNWTGAFFFILALQMLVSASRMFVFMPRELAIAEREYRLGGYYLVCWYLTKVVAELPATLVLSILLFGPAYVLIGIGYSFKLYMYMQIVLWLTSWSATGMATLLLGLFRRVRVAWTLFMLLLSLFVVFGGLLVNVDDIPDYLIWFHYISPVKYGYEALMKLFWGHIVFLACGDSDGSGSGSATFATVGDDYSFSRSSSGSFENDDGCIAHSGDQVLSHYSMDKSRTARSDSIILLVLTVLYFLIGYGFLSLRWCRYKTRQQRQDVSNN